MGVKIDVALITLFLKIVLVPDIGSFRVSLSWRENLKTESRRCATGHDLEIITLEFNSSHLEKGGVFSLRDMWSRKNLEVRNFLRGKIEGIAVRPAIQLRADRTVNHELMVFLLRFSTVPYVIPSSQRCNVTLHERETRIRSLFVIWYVLIARRLTYFESVSNTLELSRGSSSISVWVVLFLSISHVTNSGTHIPCFVPIFSQG